MTLLYVSPSAFVALAVALVGSALAAWLVGHLAIRVSGVYFVMITLAVAEVAHEAVFTADITGGSNGLFGAPEPVYGVGNFGFRFGDVIVGIEPLAFTGDSLFYYVLLGTVVASYLFVRRVMEAPFGSVLRAIRENEPRARFVGYDVRAAKRRAFLLSGTLAGLSGAMFGLYNGFAAPSLLHWINSGEVIVMAVLGGSGTLYGPMIGAAVFTVFEERLASLVPWWRLLLGSLFVLVVLFLPKGLISLPSRLTNLPHSRRAPTDEQREVDTDD
jgi:branched-chain amino acid transport system permease protein